MGDTAVRAKFPYGDSPAWGSVVFDRNSDVADSQTIYNLVNRTTKRDAGTSDGQGRSGYIPTTNSAAKERQNIVSSGWTSSIKIEMTDPNCGTNGETKPTVTDFSDSNGNKVFFKLDKSMYKQSFVSTRYYADMLGGFGGLTYTGSSTDAPTSKCTSATVCTSKATALFNYPFIMTYDNVNAPLNDKEPATSDGLQYGADINKFYPLD